MRKHMVIADRNVETVVGVAFVVTGWYLLHDAWDKRGRPMPWLLRRLAA